MKLGSLDHDAVIQKGLDKASKDYEEGIKRLLKTFPTDRNIMDVGEGWYAISYVTLPKKEVGLELWPLVKNHDMIVLNRQEREYVRGEIDLIVRGYMDNDCMVMYDRQVESNAKAIVDREYGTSLSEESESWEQSTIELAPPAPSTHALQRWAERVIGMTESESIKYASANLEALRETVIKGFNSGDLLWTDDDGIQYWFDADNIMYVFGGNTVITLYEQNFGFEKPINHSIVLQQVEVIKRVAKSVKDMEQWSENELKQLDLQVSQVKDNIMVLEAQLAVQKQHLQTLHSQQSSANKVVQSVKDTFTREYNKLFRRKG